MTCLARSHLPVHAVGIEFNLNCLPNDAVYVPRLGAENASALELDVMT
jgi:hypothetical protein